MIINNNPKDENEVSVRYTLVDHSKLKPSVNSLEWLEEQDRKRKIKEKEEQDIINRRKSNEK